MIAEDIKKTWIYEFLYRYLCEFVHSSALGIKCYLDLEVKSRTLLKPGKNYEKIPEALRYSCRFYTDILRLWSQYEGLGKEGEIRKLEKERDRVFLKNRSEHYED